MIKFPQNSMLQVYREKCRQEMEDLRKKREELVQAAEERLEQVRSESKQAEETLQMIQVTECDISVSKLLGFETFPIF